MYTLQFITKEKFMKIMIYVSIFFLYLFSFATFAQPITMYDQPIPTAKTIGTVDLSSGIIPIFTPKTGDWVKVADPKNGNVGWVKASELKSAKESGSSVIYSQKIINGTPPNTQKLTTDQQEWIKRVQTEQQIMQQKLQHMMKDMNELFQQEWETLKSNPQFPVVMPFLATPPTTINAPVPAPVTPNNNQTKPATEIKTNEVKPAN
jgi:hypothetical protein